MNKPSLYLSAYFEKHKGAYCDALTTVRASHNLVHWVKFFLVAVRETAEKGQTMFRAILDLRREVDEFIMGLGRRAPKAQELTNRLYRKPVISANETAKLLDVTHQTASALIKEFKERGFLREQTGLQRNRLYFFEPYFHLFLD